MRKERLRDCNLVASSTTFRDLTPAPSSTGNTTASHHQTIGNESPSYTFTSKNTTRCPIDQKQKKKRQQVNAIRKKKCTIGLCPSHLKLLMGDQKINRRPAEMAGELPSTCRCCNVRFWRAKSPECGELRLAGVSRLIIFFQMKRENRE
jgi:hypothetical protein